MAKEVASVPFGRAALPGDDLLRSRQRFWRRTVLAGFTALCVLGLLSLLRITPQNGRADGGNAGAGLHAPLFRGWEKPELAVVLSGQQYGYTQPCGCSHPQYGGLARRFNFIRSLKDKGWPVVALDLGDIPQKGGPQRELKYTYSMKALKQMGYAAVGAGKKEFSMPLLSALAAYTLNDPQPRVLAANIHTPQTLKEIREFVHGWTLIADPKRQLPTVGVIGLVGRSVAEGINDPDITFAADNRKVIERALNEVKGRSQVTALLLQGSLKEASAVATYCAALRAKNSSLPTLDFILCLSEEDAPPPSQPAEVKGTPTQIIQVGERGRYIGVLGVFRSGLVARPFTFKYQLVSIGPELETPRGKENENPIMALMEEYAREVKNNNYILKYPTVQHLVQTEFKDAKYVGSERCAGCHEHAYHVWEDMHKVTGAKGLSHAHAFATLEKATRPALRQFDGECVVCHTVGFNHPTGYADALRANNARMIDKLKGVGCESCHGPCSEHVKDTHNPKIHALINPWKAKGNETPEQEAKRLLRIDVFCQSCHDRDNDVHWDFAKKWPKVIHMTPRKEAARNSSGPAVNEQPVNTASPTVPLAPANPEPNFVPPAPTVPTPPAPQNTESQPERRQLFPNLRKIFRKN